MEVEAESLAYLVAAEYGLDTSDYTVAYTASWAAGDTRLIHETGERVIIAARALTGAEPVGR